MYTLRPRDTRHQATQTSQIHVFELGPNKLRWTNLCSENRKLHNHFDSLAFPLLKVTQVAQILSYTSFSISQKRTFQGLTVLQKWIVLTDPHMTTLQSSSPSEALSNQTLIQKINPAQR